MSKMIWAYDPQSGGQKIPPAIQPRIRQRILDHADKHYAGRFTRIDVRFRGQFCYIDAYTEPYVAPDLDLSHLGVSREQYIARIRATPIHLCRLRYFGREEAWSMAFYTYSHNKYEPCVFPDGSWQGTPEAAFDTGAVYLEP